MDGRRDEAKKSVCQNSKASNVIKFTPTSLGVVAAFLSLLLTSASSFFWLSLDARQLAEVQKTTRIEIESALELLMIVKQ